MWVYSNHSLFKTFMSYWKPYWTVCFLSSYSFAGEDGNEKYEKSEVKSWDHTFHKFMKRISMCPEQILRYVDNLVVTAVEAVAMSLVRLHSLFGLSLYKVLSRWEAKQDQRPKLWLWETFDTRPDEKRAWLYLQPHWNPGTEVSKRICWGGSITQWWAVVIDFQGCLLWNFVVSLEFLMSVLQGITSFKAPVLQLIVDSPQHPSVFRSCKSLAFPRTEAGVTSE